MLYVFTDHTLINGFLSRRVHRDWIWLDDDYCCTQARMSNEMWWNAVGEDIRRNAIMREERKLRKQLAKIRSEQYLKKLSSYRAEEVENLRSELRRDREEAKDLSLETLKVKLQRDKENLCRIRGDEGSDYLTPYPDSNDNPLARRYKGDWPCG